MYMLTKKEELNAILDYLQQDGKVEGPLHKKIFRVKPLLFRVIDKLSKNLSNDAAKKNKKPNYDQH